MEANFIRLVISLVALTVYFLILFVVVRAAIVSALRTVRTEVAPPSVAMAEQRTADAGGWPFK